MFVVSSWSVPLVFFWDLGPSLLSSLWILFWVECLSPLCLVVLRRFYLVASSRVYFSDDVSFCLNFLCVASVPQAAGLSFFLVLMSASWWVKFILVLVHSSWQEGLVLAHRWVELGLVPLVGRAISVGVFIGDCCLWMTRQPVCWWVGLCPTFWLVVLRYPSSGAWVLLPKWWSLGEFTLVSIRWGICNQFLPPRCVTANPCSPGDLLRPAGRSGQGFCGVGALYWGSQYTWKSAHSWEDPAQPKKFLKRPGKKKKPKR